MEAGVLLDTKMANTLWGAFVVIENGEHYMIVRKTRQKVVMPAYSTSTSDSYKIVSAFQEKGWFFRVNNDPLTNMFKACFYKEDGRSYSYSEAPTIPLVICAAALTTGVNLYK